MKRAIHILLLIVALGTSTQGIPQANTVRVPDSATALKIARPILIRTYGWPRIHYARPLSAELA
ncbi:MAG TPA: hypothetical protein VHX60_09890, partial [Acidobacteriaceae bacterium]|nr:hypothetical protein [Acidobacteriaceae bacterium]